jgi:hypothetical protein
MFFFDFIFNFFIIIFLFLYWRNNHPKNPGTPILLKYLMLIIMLFTLCLCIQKKYQLFLIVIM